MRCMLTAIHGSRQREAGEPTGAEYTYRTVQLSGSTSPIIDRIDTILADHYGLTEEELDFIINYDIKYRMSGEA